MEMTFNHFHIRFGAILLPLILPITIAGMYIFLLYESSPAGGLTHMLEVNYLRIILTIIIFTKLLNVTNAQYDLFVALEL